NAAEAGVLRHARPLEQIVRRELLEHCGVSKRAHWRLLYFPAALLLAGQDCAHLGDLWQPRLEPVDGIQLLRGLATPVERGVSCGQIEPERDRQRLQLHRRLQLWERVLRLALREVER